MGLLNRFLALTKRTALALVSPRRQEMAETFCVLPWTHLIIDHQGATKMCCASWNHISHAGVPLTVGSHSLDEIWNSDEMREVRRAMVAGKRVSACEECYRLERNGGISIRQEENRDWENGVRNEERVSIDTLKSRAVAADYHLMARPRSLQLHVGNLCNLKCRTCNGYWSSRINKDSVHRLWTGFPENDQATRAGRAAHWFQQTAVLQDLLRDPAQLRHLEFMGGETFLSREVGDMLQLLVDAGTADHIALEFTTNGTTTEAPWLALIERFASTRVIVSIDGFGKYHEYIRYPARWPKLVQNLEVLRHFPRARLEAHVTVQNYNALNVVELFRYLDSVDVPFTVYPLQRPYHLQATVLPPRARRLAAERLRAYADRDCRPEHRAIVLGLIAALEAVGDAVDAGLLREFMLFTNDLDATRGQGFQETHAELLPFFQEAGFPWTAERRHTRAGTAGRASLPLVA